MRRIVRLVIVLSVLAGVAAPASLAAERMWVGFHDDPSFRWVTDRQERVAGSAQSNAIDHATPRPVESRGEDASGERQRTRSIRRTSSTTSTRPSASAQENDQEVILTISGTPRWANGGKNPNVMPHAGRRLHQLLARDRVALLGPVRWDIRSCASGRSGTSRTSSSSSAPQFDSRGRSVAPANYAKLAAAAYTGLKAGNPQAQVAIGETSARGSDKATGIRPTHSPGKFAELVAKANPRLKFDAWSHHPYPVSSEPRRRRRS